MKRKCDAKYCVTCCADRIHSFLPIDYYRLHTFPLYRKLIRYSEGVGFTDTTQSNNAIPPDRPLPPIPQEGEVPQPTYTSQSLSTPKTSSTSDAQPPKIRNKNPSRRFTISSSSGLQDVEPPPVITNMEVTKTTSSSTTETPVTVANTLETPRTRPRVSSMSISRNKKPLPPYTPSNLIKEFKDMLSANEQKEVMAYNEIYFVGSNPNKIPGNNLSAPNGGYDDDKGDYKVLLHDHIGYRYEILGLLGNGAFGVVAKVYDHKMNKNLALKVIRNRKRYHQQALVEHKILSYIRQKDP